MKRILVAVLLFHCLACLGQETAEMTPEELLAKKVERNKAMLEAVHKKEDLNKQKLQILEAQIVAIDNQIQCYKDSYDVVNYVTGGGENDNNFGLDLLDKKVGILESEKQTLMNELEFNKMVDLEIQQDLKLLLAYKKAYASSG